MTDPEPEVYPWLPSATVLAWLKLKDGNTGYADRVVLAEVCRKAAADWVEDQRPDLFVVTTEDDEETEEDEEVRTFTPGDRVVMAGILATARLYARSDSPNGVVAFNELGVGSILSNDPDVKRQLGRNKRMPIG